MADWKDITSSSELQHLLYEFAEIKSRTHIEEFLEIGHRIQDFILDHVDSCEVEVVPARGPSWGDGGTPPEYCDNLIKPGKGTLCDVHEDFYAAPDAEPERGEWRNE